MNERKIRVGELLKRELSMALHGKWRSESVGITISEVDVSPDLRKATVYYTALGGREAVARAGKFLMKIRNQLRHIMGKNVVIKYTPELSFAYDPMVERSLRLMSIMDELDEEDAHENQEFEDDID